MKHVLVVDDEKIIADTLTAILRISGYDARQFYGAEDALNACVDFTPEIVVTDVSMPGMNGIEMAIEITERHPGCKVLLFSGNAGASNILESATLRGYAFDILAKPVHPKELLVMLGKLQSRPPESEFTTAARIPQVC